MISSVAVKWPWREYQTHRGATQPAWRWRDIPQQSTGSPLLYSALARDEITSDYIVFAHTVAFIDPHMINAFSES